MAKSKRNKKKPKKENNLKCIDGRWCIDFTYRGQRVRRIIGKSKTEAQDAIATIKTDIIREKYGFKKKEKLITFEAFAKDFFNTHSKNKKSWRRDEASLKNLTPFFKGRALSNIGPELVEKYKTARAKKVSPASVNREITLLKTMFNKAVEWEKLRTNPISKVKKFRENGFIERILTRGEASQLIDAAPNYLRPILIIALNTGMRKGEILKLRWIDIVSQNKYILIKESKSGRSRKVPMNGNVIGALEGIQSISEFVFVNQKTMKPFGDIKKSFATTCREAGITGFRFHDLRHTFATNYIQAGGDIVSLSRILGHSDIKMTMRYAHPSFENMLKAINRVGDIFEKSRHKVDSQIENKNFEYSGKYLISAN